MADDKDEKPLAPMVAERGIRTSKDFVDFMSALMADVVSGRVDPKVANAACVAGGHILKITKMQLDWEGQANNPLPFTRDTKRLGGETKDKEEGEK